MNSCLMGRLIQSGRVFGSYVHGMFDNDSFRHSFIDWARNSLMLFPAERKVFATAERDARLNRWADHLRQSIRVDLVHNWISPGSAAVEMVKR